VFMGVVRWINSPLAHYLSVPPGTSRSLEIPVQTLSVALLTAPVRWDTGGTLRISVTRDALAYWPAAFFPRGTRSRGHRFAAHEGGTEVGRSLFARD
jgi:hypothetical protein